MCPDMLRVRVRVRFALNRALREHVFHAARGTRNRVANRQISLSLSLSLSDNQIS